MRRHTVTVAELAAAGVAREREATVVPPTVEDTAAKFPRKFELPAFPGQEFTVDARRCRVHGRLVLLHVAVVYPDGRTAPFAECTEAELRREVVRMKGDTRR